MVLSPQESNYGEAIGMGQHLRARMLFESISPLKTLLQIQRSWLSVNLKFVHVEL